MKWWNFQGTTRSAKVSQQEITELTELAAGLMAFEKAYLHTHGERQPVFRLLSMINRMVSDNIDTIEKKFQRGDLVEAPEKESDSISF